jgi:uncharacterized membrane protein YccC
MKLNDPFGRLESRHQKGYESMRSALRDAGIVTPQAAAEVMSEAWRRGLTVVAVGLLLLVFVSLLLPKLVPLTLGLGLFLLVWVGTSTINGRRYIKRYIKEELEA